MTTSDPLMPIQPVRRIGGLTGNLWRLALVVGVAQFAMSIWTWQFGIYIETLVEPWQMGITFTVGTIASLIGTPLSGYVSDFVGRRKTLLSAYVPMGAGIFLLFLFPIWPFFPLFYGLIQFGWIFVVIMARAAPADQISQNGGKDAGKTFTMVLFPAFAIDGLSPLLASVLLKSGIPQQNLLLLGGIGTIAAFIVSALIVRETLATETQVKAKTGPIITLRGLGKNFWLLTGGMLGAYLAFGLAFPYLGNLVTLEWNVSTSDWGVIWCCSSLTIAALSYYGGVWADKSLKRSLGIGSALISFIILAHALLEGIYVLLLINIIWGGVIVIWIAGERGLVIHGVGEEKQGRALSTYQTVMSTAQIFMQNVGAIIWTISGSLRQVFLIAGLIVLFSLIPLGLCLRAMKLIDPKEAVHEPHSEE